MLDVEIGATEADAAQSKSGALRQDQLDPSKPSLDAATTSQAQRAAGLWLAQFNAALEATQADVLEQLLAPDCHWRDIVALTWSLHTTSCATVLAPALHAAVRDEQMQALRFDSRRSPAQQVERAGVQCIEFFARFETRAGSGEAVIRLRASDDGSYRAWTLMTALSSLHAHVSRELAQPELAVDIHAPNWLDIRHATAKFSDRDPDVLIIGGGHAGVTAAAELGQLGIAALVVDQESRIGDNWRLRYHSLKLHNRTPINHFPLMPFPATFPDYIPKDKLANWIEFYVDAMEINFWTETRFEHARYDAHKRVWDATLTCADGEQRTLHPRHIIMATSVSGTPKMPEIPSLDAFAGTLLHSSEFSNGAHWRGRNAIVMGTGTSAHDVAQNLHANGAHVTMVQRSPTMILNIEPSAQLYDALYLGDGPALAERDLINSSIPFPVVKQAHQIVTRKVREIDAELLTGLEAAGFQLEFGEDDSGWPLKYRSRGGGYYFNAGCSDLIVNGAIKLAQYADIEAFTAGGFVLNSGTSVAADLVVLATGYQGQDYLVGKLFGNEVADKVGPVWGMHATSRELNNMWTPTGQTGLWFTAGSLSQCRIYSKYLALQIDAHLRDIL
jgi:cation diffusion facilitator CzcD-associated flavoprotein CzcO